MPEPSQNTTQTPSASHAYHFITHWRVRAAPAEVIAVISDAESLPRWWPSVYLAVQQIVAGDAQGVGKRVALYTKGWLPYTLRWHFVVSEVAPDGFTLVAEGDFVGRGIWRFAQEEAGGEVWTTLTYDWMIEAQKPLLRRLSFLLKPLFAMNHEWAMRQGERSLVLELRRRQGDATIPAPPPATPSHPLRWLGYVLAHPRALR
jgi:hypothetical protein